MVVLKNNLLVFGALCVFVETASLYSMEEKVRVKDNTATREGLVNYKQRALYSAITGNMKLIVEQLTYNDQELLHCRDSEGKTALHWAVKTSTSLVEYLLQKAVPSDVRARNGKTALLLAIEEGTPEVGLYLIDHHSRKLVFPDCGILEVADDDENTPLHAAAALGKNDLVALLVQRGCSMKKRNAFSNTPLHEAAQGGHEETVKLLLMNGAQSQEFNALGATPLHCAAFVGNSAICRALIEKPDMISKLLDAHNSIRRISTAMFCLKDYRLPREVLFIIFTVDKDLAQDFAIILLLDTYSPKNRIPNISLSNTSAWRVLIHYTTDNRTGDIVLEPGSKTVLDMRPEQLTQLNATTYGKGWKMAQYTPLDLKEGLQAEAIKKPGHDIDVVIDGGQGILRQYTRPFRDSYYAFDTAHYEAISLVPESRILMDAFPCLGKGRQQEARYFLQLPLEFSEESLASAYLRLKGVWEKEHARNSGNEAFVERVLEILTTAYEHLAHKKAFPMFQLDQKIPLIPIDCKQNSIQWLQKRFFTRKMLSPDVVLNFFKQFCIELQQAYLSMKDLEKRTAYDYALMQKHEELAQFLQPDSIEVHFGEPLKCLIAQCLQLKKRNNIKHLPDTPLTQIVLGRLGQFADDHSHRLVYLVPESIRGPLKVGAVSAGIFVLAPMLPVQDAASACKTEGLMQ